MASGALVQHITKNDRVHFGTDRPIWIDVNDHLDADLDVSAFALTWELIDSDGTVAVTKSTVAGITFTNGDGTNDRVVVDLAMADTTSLDTTKRYRHRLRRTDTGDVDYIVEGDFEFVG